MTGYAFGRWGEGGVMSPRGAIHRGLRQGCSLCRCLNLAELGVELIVCVCVRASVCVSCMYVCMCH